jgi:hypothetical protein
VGPRAIAHQNDRVQYKCRCSYVEIYNEVIYDLLDVAGHVCRTLHTRARHVRTRSC